MRGQQFIVREKNRDWLASLVHTLPEGMEVIVREPTRTLDQNAKLHAMITDVKRSEPQGYKWPVDVWKVAFLSHLGHQVQMYPGLDDNAPFPYGLKTSRLNKRECADFITCAYEYGDRHGVRWSESYREDLSDG